VVEIRNLGPGDERFATETCLAFGLHGELDAAMFHRRPDATLIVASDGPAVVGWVYGHELVHPDGELTMLLYALDVADQARRRGIGKALVAAFVDDARSRDCTEVWVLTDDENDAGLATYGAAGGERDPVPQMMFTWKLADGRHS
jgi:ribosomal protein S18 acetylase RimI-like enzyme